jgi:hypothetical protein
MSNGMKYNKKVIENMKNRFVHYKIYPNYCGGFKVITSVVQQSRIITNRILPIIQTSVWGDGNSIERSYFETFYYFFHVRSILLFLPPKTILDAGLSGANENPQKKTPDNFLVCHSVALKQNTQTDDQTMFVYKKVPCLVCFSQYLTCWHQVLFFGGRNSKWILRRK